MTRPIDGLRRVVCGRSCLRGGAGHAQSQELDGPLLAFQVLAEGGLEEVLVAWEAMMGALRRSPEVEA